MKNKTPQIRRWNNADLMEFFDLYNARYFGGELERPCDLIFRKMPLLGRTVRVRAHKRRSKDDKFAIRISTSIRFSRRLWASTLLHEMVHYKQKNKYACGVYGKMHNREMLRLAVEGAFDELW